MSKGFSSTTSAAEYADQGEEWTAGRCFLQKQARTSLHGCRTRVFCMQWVRTQSSRPVSDSLLLCMNGKQTAVQNYYYQFILKCIKTVHCCVCYLTHLHICTVGYVLEADVHLSRLDSELLWDGLCFFITFTSITLIQTEVLFSSDWSN